MRLFACLKMSLPSETFDVIHVEIPPRLLDKNKKENAGMGHSNRNSIKILMIKNVCCTFRRLQEQSKKSVTFYKVISLEIFSFVLSLRGWHHFVKDGFITKQHWNIGEGVKVDKQTIMENYKRAASFPKAITVTKAIFNFSLTYHQLVQIKTLRFVKYF